MGDLLVWRVQLLVWRVQFLVWRVQLLVWRVQFLVWRVQFLVWRVHLLVWQVQLLVLTGAVLSLTVQHGPMVQCTLLIFKISQIYPCQWPTGFFSHNYITDAGISMDKNVLNVYKMFIKTKITSSISLVRWWHFVWL